MGFIISAIWCSSDFCISDMGNKLAFVSSSQCKDPHLGPALGPTSPQNSQNTLIPSVKVPIIYRKYEEIHIQRALCQQAGEFCVSGQSTLGQVLTLRTLPRFPHL